MSYFIFVKKILSGEKINVFGHGEMMRDFTYIDDVINIIINLSKSNLIKEKNDIFNICGSKPISLIHLVELFKKIVGNSKIIKRAFQEGDILKSYGSNKKLIKVLGKIKCTNFDEGFTRTLKWYQKYNKIN